MSASPKLDFTPRVLSVQAGQTRYQVLNLKPVRTAIGKEPLIGRVVIGTLGIDGDQQTDRRVHGGVERAVCVYCASSLQAWEAEWQRKLSPGCFGENLTVSGWTEQSVHIGDRFRFGSALLEVSQPREPCANLANWLGVEDLIARIRLNYRTGWYCRVIETGEGAPGLSLEREFEEPSRVSVAEAYRVRIDRNASRSELRRVLEVPALSSGWKVSLGKR